MLLFCVNFYESLIEYLKVPTYGRIQGYSLVFLEIPNFFEILLCIYVYILVYIYVYCNIMYCFRSLQPK